MRDSAGVRLDTIEVVSAPEAALKALATRIASTVREWPGALSTDAPTVSDATAATIGGRTTAFQGAVTEVVSRGAWDAPFNRWKVQGGGPFTGADFILDGDSIEFEYVPVGATIYYQIVVDGRAVTEDFVSLSTTVAYHYLKLAFASARRRRVQIYISGINGFRGVIVPMQQSLSPAPRGVVIGWVGDSFLAGSNGSPGYQSYAWSVTQSLGCEYTGSVAGGTGFVSTGSFAKYDDPARVATVAATDSDLIVMCASVNDDGLAGLAAAVTTTLNAYAAACPGVPIVVLGPQPTNSTDTIGAVRAANAAAVRASALAHPAVLAFFDMLGTVDGVPAVWAAGAYTGQSLVTYLGSVWKADFPESDSVSGTPGVTAAWSRVTWGFDGTGRVGATTGNGNRDTYLHSDSVHPTPSGQKALAAMALRSILSLVGELAR
ncbi:SGNH/GDSL hydrolase family protein [Microbacterium allomyrinae]|uniref:SGNH/GDSL hydrolase family protein n=1 Tax=Microbacterium allomyrinae TaxID=2830666 RepID=A0A9X1LW09_9MICO|nr:SGNH/GDSL hydrolase family protein [Microbacterium allomyrinae]